MYRMYNFPLPCSPRSSRCCKRRWTGWRIRGRCEEEWARSPSAASWSTPRRSPNAPCLRSESHP